jgi:hypothetical protein
MIVFCWGSFAWLFHNTLELLAPIRIHILPFDIRCSSSVPLGLGCAPCGMRAAFKPKMAGVLRLLSRLNHTRAGGHRRAVAGLSAATSVAPQGDSPHMILPASGISSDFFNALSQNFVGSSRPRERLNRCAAGSLSPGATVGSFGPTVLSQRR